MPASASHRTVDAVVVGARCAGSATAAMLAQAGRSVVVLDRTRFPADTLSTHAMFPSGCAELQRVGVWPRVLSELDPARLRYVQIDIDAAVRVRERWQPVDGIDFGMSVPRNLLDILLVENAREQGAEVLERCAAEEVLWRAGRAVGVAYCDPDGERHELYSDVVVGADGRRSTVAAEVGAWRPYRVSKNGRGLVFRYMDDPVHEPWHAETMWQWRDGDSLAFAFPNPNGRVLALFMGAADEVTAARHDPEAYWLRKLSQHPGAAARLAGATAMTKIRSTADVQAYWRASSGPGWVLAGDAAHFKDPVTGQGMGDALRMGRTLGEALAPVLGDPAAADRASRRWEHETTTHCLHAYHFANADTIVRSLPAVVREVLRDLGADEEPELSHIFGRTKTPQEVLRQPVVLRALARALGKGPDRRRIAREALSEAAIDARIKRELRRDPFRPADPVEGSDHPGWTWWDPPAVAAERAAEEREPAAA